MESTPDENKIFKCQNPDCGKESCRLCKEISHIPLRCEEVEKDAEVRKRTYIENKMTEAMIRKVYYLLLLISRNFLFYKKYFPYKDII